MTRQRVFRFTGFGVQEQKIVRLAEDSGQQARDADRLLASARRAFRLMSDDPMVMRRKYSKFLDMLLVEFEEDASAKAPSV